MKRTGSAYAVGSVADSDAFHSACIVLQRVLAAQAHAVTTPLAPAHHPLRLRRRRAAERDARHGELILPAACTSSCCGRRSSSAMVPSIGALAAQLLMRGCEVCRCRTHRRRRHGNRSSKAVRVISGLASSLRAEPCSLVASLDVRQSHASALLSLHDHQSALSLLESRRVPSCTTRAGVPLYLLPQLPFGILWETGLLDYELRTGSTTKHV